jgi:outer membrane protein OmpA-like peptidoglycan-associated protein
MYKQIFSSLKRFMSIAILLGSVLSIQAQEKELKKADEATKASQYQTALDWYQKAADKGHEFTSREKLDMASLYYAIGDYEHALENYASFYEGGFRDTATSLLKYAHCLYVQGDESAYQSTLSKLQSSYPKDSRVNKLDDPFYMKNKRLFEEVHMLTDTIYNAIQVVENKGMVYASNLNKDRDQLVEINESKEKSPLYPEWKFNQGGLTFSEDGNSMIVTLNDHKGNRLSYYNRSTSNLNLYRIDKVNGVWGEPSRLNVNINGYNTANPSLSGNWLYYVSDRPGGIGGTDIYRSELLENGNYGPAKNLGEDINTEGRESYVFVDGSIMYFSSDGYPGYGGMDVLATDLNDSDHKVFNLGAPINSAYDDFGYSRAQKQGYVSSNRLGQLASFNYILTRDLVLSEEFDAIITIDNKDLNLGEAVLVLVKDELGNEVWRKELSQLSAQLRVPKLLNSKEYTLDISGKTIKTISAEIASNTGLAEVQVNTSLESTISEEVSIDQQIELADILFDFDKYTTEIDKDVLDTYIKVLASATSVHIQGFSDQRGLASYNKKLSLKRAEFFRDLLIENGISASITVEGLGESNLRYNCREENCSEEMERENRRVELLVSY